MTITITQTDRKLGLLVVILVFLFFIFPQPFSFVNLPLYVEDKAICEFCIKTNWSGYAQKELEINCSELIELKSYCEKMVNQTFEEWWYEKWFSR